MTLLLVYATISIFFSFLCSILEAVLLSVTPTHINLKKKEGFGYAKILEDFGISYEAKVVSAHRTPDLMFEFAENAKKKGFKIIIAGAGGAAHLPGMIAAKTTLPVLGIPIPTKHLEGQDSLLSIVQMPKGIPVATFAIG